MNDMKSQHPHRDRISKLTKHYRLREAMAYIHSHDTRHVCTALLSESENTFKYMLDYFGKCTNGVTDASRADIVSTTVEELLRAADCLDFNESKDSDSSQYFSIVRTIHLRPDNNIANALDKLADKASAMDLAMEAENVDLQLQTALEDASDFLFNCVWSALYLSKQEKQRLLDFICEDTCKSSNSAKALCLTALMLSSLKYYDYSKLRLLLEAVLKLTDTNLRARALVGALLIISRHTDRVLSDKKTLALAEAIADDNTLGNAIRSFVPAMVRTIDTDRVNKTVNDRIIPEIMRLKPDIEKRMRRINETADIDDVDQNPDWEELLEKSGITNHLQELTEMQAEGADILMSAFSKMKSFPFFRRISNWLLPFDINHSALKNAKSLLPERVLSIYTSGDSFCSSDKYSMFLGLSVLPSGEYKMMHDKLNEQLQSVDMDSLLLDRNESEALNAAVKSYLKDLFRFYRLKNDDDTDPFGKLYEIPAIAPFQPLHTDEQLQRSIAEFYFKYGYYQQAYDVFNIVRKLSNDSIEDVLQKQGYCLQMIGRKQEALEIYRNAEMLNPDSDWLLKRMASLFFELKQYNSAAEYAIRALERKPDNLALESILGNALMMDGKAKDALKSFYKIRYIKPDNTKVLRPIAWCEFILGNYDKSIAIYDSVPDMQASDMLNSAHALFAKGDIAGAQQRYKSCIGILDGGEAQFATLMDNDRKYLMDAGIPELDIYLMENLLSSADKQ